MIARRNWLHRLAVAGAASVLAVTGLATLTPQAQAATSTCHAAWKTVNWDRNTLIASADVAVYCPSGAVYVQLVHPTSASGPCRGYGGTTHTIHYSFHPSWSWTPVGTYWRLVYCSESGSGYVPEFVGTGGGGSW